MRLPILMATRPGNGRCTLSKQTRSPAAVASETGQGTKSLRDSPLRGGLPARAVTKGEIVDSGHVGLS